MRNIIENYLIDQLPNSGDYIHQILQNEPIIIKNKCNDIRIVLVNGVFKKMLFNNKEYTVSNIFFWMDSDLNFDTGVIPIIIKTIDDLPINSIQKVTFYKKFIRFDGYMGKPYIMASDELQFYKIIKQLNLSCEK